MTQPVPALTLVLPLRAKESISVDEFYQYWLNAHVTLPARFPGIDTIWLHKVSFGRSRWPQVPGVSNRPAPAEEFHGVPEAVFTTMDGLAEFQAASRVQMEDGINFLAEMIGYASLGDHSRTTVDTLDLPAPRGDDGLLRHLVFVRRRPEVPVADFRRFVTDTLVPAYAGAPQVRKLRHHLFEELDITLDHPGVIQYKPPAQQYQAALEIVVADESELDAFAAGPAWAGTVGPVEATCAAVHAARVERCITTKYRGTITLAGVRGVAVADLIYRLGADSQREQEVSDLFLASPIPSMV